MKRITIGIFLALTISLALGTSVALAGPVEEITVIPGDGAYIDHGEDAGRPDVDVIRPDGMVVPPDAP